MGRSVGDGVTSWSRVWEQTVQLPAQDLCAWSWSLRHEKLQLCFQVYLLWCIYLWHHISPWGKVLLAPEPHPSGLPQPRGNMRGLGSCWRDVPAHFGSISREKALGSPGGSYLHGAIRKNQLGPHEVTMAALGASSWWRADGARGFLMFSSCSSCPQCSHTVPVPSLQPLQPALGQGAAPQAAAHPKQSPPNQTHYPEKHTVV